MPDDAPEGAVCYWQHVSTCPLARKVGGGNWRLYKHRITLPRSQPKAMKSKSVDVYGGVLHLAPGDLSGYEMCPARTAGCTKACLGVSTVRVRNFSGIQEARIRRTQDYMEERPTFMADLSRDIAAVVRAAGREGMTPAIRLNGTSDQPWESVRVTIETPKRYDPSWPPAGEYRNLMVAYNGEPGHGPLVQFYDYTKLPTRVMRSLGRAPGWEKWPTNYHLTFSYSEEPDSMKHAEEILAAGGNVAAVFRHDIPATWHGYPVIDATKHDARYLDDPGTIAGLRALGTAVKDTSGFVLDSPLPESDAEGQERRREHGSLLRPRDRGRGERHMALV